MADIKEHSVLEKNQRISPDASSNDLPDASAYGISEKRLLRKLDLHLLPGVCILYLLSFLDRSNVANAKLDGLTTSLHMTGNQYLTGLTVFFIGYILLEVFWNVVLKRVGPKLWLPSVRKHCVVIEVLFDGALTSGTDHSGMGCRGDPARRCDIQWRWQRRGWLLRCALHPRLDGRRAISWRCL